MNSLPMTFNPQADVPSGKVRLVPQAPHIGSKPSTPSAVYHQNAIALPIKDGVVSPNLNTSAPDFLKRRRVIADTAQQALQQLYRLSEGATSEMFGEFDIRKIEMLADGRLDPFTLISDESATRKYYHEGSTTLNAFLNLGIELFHFTAENNVPSILDKGLLSANLLRSKGVTTVHVSDGLSQSLDRTRGLDRYVHLFFTRDAAMKYSVSQRTETSLAWFRVSPAVLDWPGTLFCRNYANKNGAEWVPFSEMTSLDLTLLLVGFGRIGYWQAMVQNNVPPLYLRSI